MIASMNGMLDCSSKYDMEVFSPSMATQDPDFYSAVITIHHDYTCKLNLIKTSHQLCFSTHAVYCFRVDPDSPLANDLAQYKEKEGKDFIHLNINYKVSQLCIYCHFSYTYTTQYYIMQYNFYIVTLSAL